MSHPSHVGGAEDSEIENLREVMDPAASMIEVVALATKSSTKAKDTGGSGGDDVIVNPVLTKSL